MHISNPSTRRAGVEILFLFIHFFDLLLRLSYIASTVLHDRCKGLDSQFYQPHTQNSIMPGRLVRERTSQSDNDSDSGYSDGSDHSHSTAPTVYSDNNRNRWLKFDSAALQSFKGNPWEEASGDLDPRISTETYASTIASAEDVDEDLPPFGVPEHEPEQFESTAIPSTPSDFSEYFPSTRRLYIRHDDATLDGNMNLRVDTKVAASEGKRLDLTLFHLRMHDLKNREFSFRRYCRDSGREICHSSRKYTVPATARRPGLQRSMSNALSSFRSKTEPKIPTTSTLKRQDSGYDSMSDDEENGDIASQAAKGRGSVPLPTNTTKLEFSNYAHLDIKRRGTKGSKRYEFEHWGTNYAWKRFTKRRGSSKETSYHLVNAVTSHSIAHIVPAALTPAEAQEEDAKGGWVPPCSLWISDEKVLSGRTDVAEYVQLMPPTMPTLI